VEALRPVIQKMVDDLIDELLAGPKPVDLVQAFALPVPSKVICELLGVPYADHDFFQANSKALITRTATPEQSCPQKGQPSPRGQGHKVPRRPPSRRPPHRRNDPVGRAPPRIPARRVGFK
jgi:cytochrome P450